MTQIKLHDRVELKDGRTGSIVFDNGDLAFPLLFIADAVSSDEPSMWLQREDDTVTEIIGHRYFVDTPYTIGETYEARSGHVEEVIGVGLICRNRNGGMSYRKPDGTHDFTLWSLLPPTNPEPDTRDGEIVEIKGRKYQLKLVEG